jgi:hypothetical protein
VEDVPVPEQALDDPEPLVREHAAWALHRIGGATPAADRLRSGAEVMAPHRA